MYLACTSYLIPTIVRTPTMSLTEAIFSLVFPFLFLDVLIFYILFECICNLAAEVTNFANRNFYDVSPQVFFFVFSFVWGFSLKERPTKRGRGERREVFLEGERAPTSVVCMSMCFRTCVDGCTFCQDCTRSTSVCRESWGVAVCQLCGHPNFFS